MITDLIIALAWLLGTMTVCFVLAGIFALLIAPGIHEYWVRKSIAKSNKITNSRL